MILGQEPISRLRYAAQVRDSEGYIVDAAPTSSTIYASVQPMNGKDVEQLSEGERHREGLKLYTQSDLRTADQYLGTIADKVVIDGITYEVMHVERQRSILPHYKAMVLRLQEEG